MWSSECVHDHWDFTIKHADTQAWCLSTEVIYRGQMSLFDELFLGSFTVARTLKQQESVFSFSLCLNVGLFSSRCVEQMVTSSDDYLMCLSQIWSRYEVFHSKMSRPTFGKSVTFEWKPIYYKLSRWFKWSCLFFTDAEWGIWFLSASQKCSRIVLENELFISVFSSEPRVSDH